MASLKISFEHWQRYLARDDVDFTIEELIFEGPDGSEHNDTDVDFPAGSTLRIHEGVVCIEGLVGEISLKKHIQEWLQLEDEKAREVDTRPYVMVRGPTHLLKAIEAMAKSFQVVDKSVEVTTKLA